MTFSRWLINMFIAVDQLVNALFLGDPDETISSRIGKRVHWYGDKGWRLWLSKFLDLFQKDHTWRSIELDEGEKYPGKDKKDKKDS